MLRLFTLALLISFVAAELRKIDLRDIKPTKFAKDPNWNLVFFQSLWRHGDRNPIFQIPNDPLKSKDWEKGGRGFGQLTPVGMRQHFTLGRQLRVYYDQYNFLSDKYVSNEIFVRSTDVNRTLISAMSNMAGFFHETGKKNIDYPADTAWPTGYVPIPIHTVPEHWDPVLGVHDCAFEQTVYTKLRNTPEWINTTTQNKDLIDKVSDITGIKDLKIEYFPAIRDTLFIERTWDVQDPWFKTKITDDLFNKIDKLAGIVDDFEDGINVKELDGVDFSLEFPRLNGGPLLWTIVDHMNQKRFCLDKPEKDRTDGDKKLCDYFDTLKYYAFSAHDTTIASLFSTFGFKESNYNTSGLPHYAACVTIELHQSLDKKNYKVEVLYWPDVPKDNSPEVAWVVTSKITGCENGCSLDAFNNRSQPYKIQDMNKFCALNEGSGNNNSSGIQLMSFSFMIILIAFVFSRFDERL